MNTCDRCGGPMIPLFTGAVCKAECDLDPRDSGDFDDLETPTDVTHWFGLPPPSVGVPMQAAGKCSHKVTYSMDNDPNAVFCYLCGKRM